MNQTILDQKKLVVDEIAGKFRESQSAVVIEYRGLTVAQVTTLRRKLRDEGIELKVYKNSMAQRAAEEVGHKELVTELVGPNAIAFGKDAVAPSRILSEFAIKNKALILKGGLVEGKVVDADMIKVLAKLPNKDGMISMLLSVFQAPVRNFAYAIKQIADQREANQ